MTMTLRNQSIETFSYQTGIMRVSILQELQCLELNTAGLVAAI
jgi:hypothetical protein